MKSGAYITCCLLLLCGCAQTNWRQAMLPAPRNGERIAARERVMVEQLIDETSREPRASVPLLRAQNPDQPGIAITSSSASKTARISHDPATLALIDRETRDFSPADRERAIAALKAIPADSVPAVLQLWKAGLISQFGHPSDPMIRGGAAESDRLAQTNFGPAESLRADTGLGQRSPWPDADSRSAGNAPPDWNQQPAATSPRSQDINRINTLAYGYSSPLPGSGLRLGMIEANNSDDSYADGPSITSRNGGQTSSRDSVSRDSVSHDSVSHDSVYRNEAPVSADWQMASQYRTDPATPIGDETGSFGSEPGRPLVMPGEWQTTTPRRSSRQVTSPAPMRVEQPVLQRELARTAPQRAIPSRRSSYAAPASLAAPPPQLRLPERPSGPLIRPRTKEESRVSPPVDKPAFQQMGYSEPVPSEPRQEIPLAPGQALPGFERNFAEVQNPVYERDLATAAPSFPQQVSPPGVVPGAYRNERDNAAWRMPPAAQRTPSPDEALQFLVRATESEVSQLTPGRSAAELQYYIERHVYLRLLYLMAGQAEWALRPIPNIPAADQEFWTQVLWGVQNYFDLPRIPNHAERAAQTIAQFNTAMLRLKERAPLDLKNVTFCHTIEGFGEYETYSKDEFSPGQRVLVYAEIGNFHSELSTAGIYRTRLKSTLQVVATEAPQEPIDVKVYPVTEDYCRNHRRDYFHSYVVEIPVRCVRGSHELKLIVEDEQSGKVATHSVPFVVR